MYLTYEEYIQMGGNTLDELEYNSLEFEARSTIDFWTFNRLVNEETYSESVKRCMFYLIKLIKDKQQAMNVDTASDDDAVKVGIVSESNDGVSTSYNILSAKEVLDSCKTEIESTIRRYLQNVRNSLGQKVLYRGIYPNE